jgi:hypothetical protein
MWIQRSLILKKSSGSNDETLANIWFGFARSQGAWMATFAETTDVD